MSSKGKGTDKGKAIAGKGSSAKRKRDDDKTGGRKRINRAVLQFFEDAADEASDYDTSDFEDDFPDDDDHEVPKEQVEPGRLRQLPVFPKEEELSGDELERVLEERYKSGSGYVTYAEDDYETKGVDKNFVVPSAQDPVIWKVKCKIGRERQSIFCLMQKYVDLKSLGTKLQIVSAFSVEHVRGFIFVEANKQFEVMEACKQLPDVYYSMINHVPSSEFSQLLAVRRKQTEVSKGMWVRLKHGNYKNDLAQVVGVSDSRKKATVKLIPRVDFQALAAKFGAGSSTKRSVIPKPRLITSSDLEEFRPLIQYRRDRDTGMQFEVLDSLMLKDGFLYKKVSIDSLRFCDVNPSVEELQKFRTSNNEDSGNLEFLSQLYGDKKEKSTLKPVQGGGKGEGTSGSKEQEGIQVHDLVLFGKREFGMVLGMEKDESYKILKYGSEGSAVVSLAKKDLKNLNLEKKFNALDHRMKTIFFNDVVKILDGPLKDKEGVVKQIYRGIIFLYDQNDLEDNAYFCAKSQLCEKVKHNDMSCLGKNDEAGPSGCEDLPSSPKTPLSPEKPWQAEEQDRNFNRREQEGGFSVGQSLRIRVGPLKGYLCRVLAVRRSDVTVKLDSRSKVLTVKSEHLSEVRGKSFATSTCDDTGLDSSKPFDFLGNNDGGNDWMASSVNADKNEDGQSNEGSAWPAFTSSASAQPWGASSVDISGPTAAEDDAWQKKPSTTLEGGSSWGQDVVKADSSSAPPNDATSSWDKDKNITGSTSSWGNVSAKKSCENTTQASQNAWDQSKSSQDKGTSSPVKGSWGKAVDTWGNKCSSSGIDDWKAPSTDPQNGGTGGASWSQPEEQKEAGGWKKTNEDPPGANSEVGGDNWGKPKSSSGGASWTKSDLKLDDGLTQNGRWTGGRGSGERSSGTAAWESGNSGSSGWVKPSESDKDSEGKWGSVKAGDASDVQPDSWKKPNSSGAEGASWGKPAGNPSGEDAPSWVTAGNGGWGQSSRSDNDQESNGGRGFGGRRGRGNYGGRFDQSGRGRGRSVGRGQWNKESQDWQSSAKGEGSSWGQEKGGSSCGDAASAGKDDQSGAGGWGKDKGGNGWGNSSGGGTQGEGNSWGKKGGDTGGGGWGKSSGGGTDGGGWGSSSGGNGWGNSSGGGTQGEGKGGDTGGGGWGKSSGGGTDGGGWGSSSGGNGWGNSSGGGTQGEGKGGDTGGGGWGKSSGGSTYGGGWGSSSGGGTGGGGWGTGSYGGSKGDEGGGGRGRGDFGGRRGRGGYQGGGRDQGGGRGRGRSFGGGRQSWNSDGQDKPSWGSSGGNGNQGGGWGSNKDGNEGGGGGRGWGGTSGGGGGSYKDGNEGGGGGRGSWGGASGGGWGSKKDANEGGGGGRGSWSGSSGGGWGSDKDGNEGGGGGRGSWGGSSGGGGSWGSSPGGSTGGAKGNESGGGGGGWGGSTGGSTVAGGWGAGSSGGSKDKEGGGSGWGKSEGGDAGSGGWANSAGGKSEAGGSSGGWGNSAGGKSEAGGSSGWGKDPAGGGGGDSSGGGNNDKGGGWGKGGW